MKLSRHLEYGELNDHVELVNTCENLMENLNELQKFLNQLVPLRAQYDKMCLPARIELDLFFAYALISLHWIHLRIHGVDPMTHPIIHELQRIKQLMEKWQDHKDLDKRPKVNIRAVKRFIRSGLYDRNNQVLLSMTKKRDPKNKK